MEGLFARNRCVHPWACLEAAQHINIAATDAPISVHLSNIYLTTLVLGPMHDWGIRRAHEFPCRPCPLLLLSSTHGAEPSWYIGRMRKGCISHPCVYHVQFVLLISWRTSIAVYR